MSKVITISGNVTMSISTDEEDASAAMHETIGKFYDNLHLSKIPLQKVELTDIDFRAEDFT